MWHNFTNALWQLWLQLLSSQGKQKNYVDKGVLKILGAYKIKIYCSTQILILLKWDVEFHVHTYASLLVVGALLA
jgi:hypothetical protein